MDRRSLTEIGVTALIAVICTVVMFKALALPPGRFEPLGSGPVPFWTSVVVIVCCLMVMGRAVRKVLNSPPSYASSDLNFVGGGIMLGLTIVYVAALHLKVAGFGIITFFYLALLILGMERFKRSRVVPAVILSALAAFGAQYVFTEIFVVDLPV